MTWSLIRILSIFAVLTTVIWVITFWPSLASRARTRSTRSGSIDQPNPWPLFVAMLVVGVATLAVGLTAITILTSVDVGVSDELRAILATWLLCLVLVSPPLTRLCLGRPEPWKRPTTLVWRCLVTSAVFGTGTLGLILVAERFNHRTLIITIFYIYETPTLMALTAALSCVFGAICIVPLRRVKDVWAHDSHEAFDLSVWACGLWLGGVGGICAVVSSSFLFALDVAWWHWTSVGLDFYVPSTIVAIVSVATSAWAAVIGTSAAALARKRLRNRRQWLERVREGMEPSWKVGPPEEPGDTAILRPLFHCTELPSNVLWKKPSSLKGGAYRTSDGFIPWALV